MGGRWFRTASATCGASPRMPSPVRRRSCNTQGVFASWGPGFEPQRAHQKIKQIKSLVSNHLSGSVPQITIGTATGRTEKCRACPGSRNSPGARVSCLYSCWIVDTGGVRKWLLGRSPGGLAKVATVRLCVTLVLLRYFFPCLPRGVGTEAAGAAGDLGVNGGMITPERNGAINLKVSWLSLPAVEP